MARRISLPRLNQKQRAARWQRERRQQAVVVVVFSAVVFFVVGVAAWVAADRYYDQNLAAVATYDGRSVPVRDYRNELRFQIASYYASQGIPPEQADPAIESQAQQFVLDSIMEQAVLDEAARAAAFDIAPDELQRRFERAYGQYRSRHVLVEVNASQGDAAVADAAALAIAQEVAAQLRADPMNQELWNSIARERSADPGSKDSGGDLGFVSGGDFVKPYEDAANAMAIGEVSDPVRSDFGYHVIQVLERRTAAENEALGRIRAFGVTTDDLKLRVRYDVLREEFSRRAQEVALPSPTEQVRLAWIQIAMPTPTAGNSEGFTAALQRIEELKAEIAKGTDFAQLAATYSEDTTTAQQGGEIGWFARGMLGDADVEQKLFALASGEVSEQFSTESNSAFYRVLEKDPARELTEEQRTSIVQNAYRYWIEKEKRDHGATILSDPSFG